VGRNRDVQPHDNGRRYVVPASLEFPGTSPDLTAVTRLAVEAAVPGFADAAGVFVLEHLLNGGAPAAELTAAQIVVRRLGTKLVLAERAAFPPGEVLVFAADSPYGRCILDDAPAVFGQPDGATLERVRPDARQILTRYTSFVAAPMTVRGAPVGFLALARSPGGPGFSTADAVVASELATRAGTGIDGALTLIRRGLDASLDSARRGSPPLSELAGIEVAGRCLPAAGYDSGGDWYDVIPLPSGRTGIIVGDVMGHGTQATTVMTQLRTAAHVLAGLDLPPAEVLRHLNRATLALPYGTLATCAYAVIDAGGRTCTLAAAGHLPPVLAMPDGTTRIPDLPGGQSLGVGAASYGQARIKLPPGAILALYTDGLVETRTRPFEEGILALRSVLGSGHRDLDAACHELVTTLAEPREDDVTIVLVKMTSEGSLTQR